MDKEQAKRIIKETFEQPFDKARFTAFIKNLLNRIEEAPFTYQGQYIPDAYKPYISVLERIGKFSSGENKIDILIIRLKKETSLERARTMQRNFVAWYLNGSRGGELKDAALVAYISPDENDWRFSLVKMDYKFEQTPNGKIKVKEEFTPARRWSFLVGVNERSHTAQSRLVHILANDEKAPTLAELEEAFNIETVTKEFFLKYRDLFIRTKEALDKLVTNDARIQADFEAKGANAVDFAKKLLGQIIFLYFLQKKGWFGAARDADWGDGSKQFLRELFEKKHGGYDNFFNDILEPLFYEALRNDRSHDDDYYSRFNCKIPFLNGGLFDPIGNYDWVHTDICLPDAVFSNNNKTKEGDIGDGILDIFDRYNFTVKEDEPLEKEVAIDPELLGKAYEKFNAIRPDNFEEYKKVLKSGKKGDESKFNKQFGVYYTPREIVHYMCRESLINYLAEVTQASSLSLSTDYDGQNADGQFHRQDACATIMYFDPNAEFGKQQRNLPHWRQAGTTYFVTFRLYDSIPKEKVENIKQERIQWLETNNIHNPDDLSKLSDNQRQEYYRLFSKRYDALLDNGYGSCLLAQSECKEIVEKALRYFDGERYHLDKFVVMPNHIHVIVIPIKDWTLAKITHSWKSYTANEINKVTGREGQFWMPESFDHIIRSPDQLEKVRKYIVTQASSLRDNIQPGQENSGPVSKNRQDACVTLQDIQTLIHMGEQVGENDARVESKGKETSTYSYKLPESIRKNAGLIDGKLADITVCDPAVGSGAFPVGMMSEIVKIRNVLTTFIVTQASSLSNHRQDARATYNFKRRCIEHSLYGVDIDPGAVEIAKLRLWLSLVVDEDDIKNIKPLPNLDYKIVCGNSLLGYPYTPMGLEKIEKLKELFIKEVNPTRKNELRSQIDDAIYGLFENTEKSLGYKVTMDYKINFSEVFREKGEPARRGGNGGGFDVVIANPPYVRQEAIRPLKPHLAKVFGDFYCGTADLYTYFYKCGINLLKPGGHLCFIAPNKFMRAGYGKHTRILLTTRVTPKLVIDFGDLPIFDATTYPSILLIEKREPEGADKTIAATFTDSSQLERLEETLSDIAFPMPVKALREEGWNLEMPEVLSLMEKLRSAGIPLGEYVQGRFYRGILTGFNDALVIDAATREKLITEDPKSAELIKPWLRGRDIRKWKSEWAGLYVIFTRRGTDIEKYVAIKRHLEQFRADLEPRKSDKDQHGRKPGPYKWFEIQDNIAYFEEFEKPKIMYAEISTEGKFLLETEGYYSDTTTYIMDSSSEYLLGVLNSKVFTYMFSKTSSEISGGFFRWKRQYMELIPVVPATDAQKAPIIERVHKILADPDSPDVPRLEAEINNLVYNLYGLKDKELVIIEEKRRQHGGKAIN